VVIVDNKIVGDEIFERKFVCDLNACKGACCIHGESGAPLEKAELKKLEEVIDAVKPYMNKKGLAAIKKQGLYEIDSDGDYVTPLVGPAEECAYVYFDDKKIAKCAIEQAYLNGETKWHKPISCHLYPIRVSKLKTSEALNYHEWEICEPACACGDKLDVPVYKFLKQPLIRKYGEDWYKQLEAAAPSTL
jgi:Protein of unknown function (DUF3109)